MSPTRQARETREDDQAAAEREPALQRDQAADVARVALAEVGRDLVVNGADLAAERVDLGLAERKGQGGVHRMLLGGSARHHSANSTSPAAAQTQSCTR